MAAINENGVDSDREALGVVDHVTDVSGSAGMLLDINFQPVTWPFVVVVELICGDVLVITRTEAHIEKRPFGEVEELTDPAAGVRQVTNVQVRVVEEVHLFALGHAPRVIPPVR